MRIKRFYVPKDGRACNFHSRFENWNEAEIPDSFLPFSIQQIVDMVDLLRMDAIIENKANNRVGKRIPLIFIEFLQPFSNNAFMIYFFLQL